MERLIRAVGNLTITRSRELQRLMYIKHASVNPDGKHSVGITNSMRDLPFQNNSSRRIHTSCVRHKITPGQSMVLHPGDPAEDENTMPGVHCFHHPSKLEKRLLVVTRMFRRTEDIPETVSYTTISKAKDIMRVCVCIVMMLITVSLSVVTVRYSREAVRRNREEAIKDPKWFMYAHAELEKRHDRTNTTKSN